MCNEVARRIALHLIREDFNDLKIPLIFPEGLPNLADAESIRITDTTAIVRAGGAGAELVMRRWSWPGSGGKPVYNYRSDGRDLQRGRCLVPITGFYEFTAPPPGTKLKSKWRFSAANAEWFALGGLWRTDERVGEAFTLLTCPPGPDVAPYHSRQMVVIGRSNWQGWLDGTLPSGDVCVPRPPDTLSVGQVR